MAVPCPTGVPRPPGRIEARVPGDPSRHRQLPSSSPRRAARPRQHCQPASTSSINSLHTVHIDRLCSLPGSPSLARPPPRRLLHRWAARAACCMIHTNSLTQGNQWARKSTRSKARSLSGDRPHNKETQRAAASTPPEPGAPRGNRGTRWPSLSPPPLSRSCLGSPAGWGDAGWEMGGNGGAGGLGGLPAFPTKRGDWEVASRARCWGSGRGWSPPGQLPSPPKSKRKHIPLLHASQHRLPYPSSGSLWLQTSHAASMPQFPHVSLAGCLPSSWFRAELCQAALVCCQACSQQQ